MDRLELKLGDSRTSVTIISCAAGTGNRHLGDSLPGSHLSFADAVNGPNSLWNCECLRERAG